MNDAKSYVVVTFRKIYYLLWVMNFFMCAQVKEVGKNFQKDDDAFDDALDSSTSSPFDQVAAYKQMLELMEEGETVAKALRRLGGNKTLSASERLKRKKAGLSIETNGDAGKVTELTELANRILTKTGNMNVYQESYQQIKNMVRLKFCLSF